MTLYKKLERMCTKHGFHPPVEQKLYFGYTAYAIDTDSWEDFLLSQQLITKMPGATGTGRWYNGDGGVFEGRIRVMDTELIEQYNQEVRKYNQYVEDWWNRYHQANKEERRLMECGKIA